MAQPSLRTVSAVNAVVTAVAGAIGWRRTLAVSKSLIVPLLQDKRMSSTLRVALAGAWAGDVILLPPRIPEDEAAARRRLHRGAAAFAVQQMGYLTLMRRAGISPKAKVAVPVALWLAGIAVLDGRIRGRAPDPWISGYGLLLGTSTITAMSSGDAALRRGGAVFVASDSMIMLRELLLKDPTARAVAEGFVLLSYALAQRSLVDGLTPLR